MEENIKISEDEGIHMHCLTCHRIDCITFKNCPITSCTNCCGIKFHTCKLKEHMSVCRNQLRPCVNQSNGCPFKLDSVSMMTHLELCPASVIHCGMNWNRYPLYSKVRQQWLPFYQGNPVQIVGHLDTELALSDQLHLHKEMNARMRKGEYHIREKRMKSRIDEARLKKLESLLTKASSTKLYEENHTCKHIGAEHSNQSGDEYEEEDNPLLTYDEAVTSKSDLATFVTNTNIRASYCDLPSGYVDSGNYICELITRKLPNDNKAATCSDLTAEEIETRMSIYSELNISYTPLGLNIVLEKLPIYHKQYPMYNFSCSKVFRRDQYSWHCLNIHSEIQDNLNGNLFKRCPMAQYGCPFLQFLLKPKNGKVVFYKPFSSFTSTFDHVNRHNSDIFKFGNMTLLDLHYDILLYILCFLDNMSINCLAKTSHAMKNLCFDVLDKKGVVIPIWSKKTYANGGSSWQIERKVRLFTTSCSPIREWIPTDVPCIGNHLAKCSFYKRPKMSDQVKLPVDGSKIDIEEILIIAKRKIAAL